MTIQRHYANEMIGIESKAISKGTATAPEFPLLKSATYLVIFAAGARYLKSGLPSAFKTAVKGAGGSFSIKPP